MASPLETGLEYAGYYNWQVVPLYGSPAEGVCTCRKGGDCPSAGKHPILPAWQKESSSDEDKITAWIGKYPGANIGIRLGQDSGIIDIECDDEEAEELVLKLFQVEGEDEGNWIPQTPMFQAHKGKHRLFNWSSEVPFPDKSVFKLGKNNTLEFRTGNGGGAQSVFPPSQHASGAKYTWLIHPSECEVAELPDHVIAKLAAIESGLDTDSVLNGGQIGKGKPVGFWDDLYEGVSDGGRNVAAAQMAGKLLRGKEEALFDENAMLEVFGHLKTWNRNNKPPIDEKELRIVFNSIHGREMKSAKERGIRETKAAKKERAKAAKEREISETRAAKKEAKKKRESEDLETRELKVQLKEASLYRPDLVNPQVAEEAKASGLKGWAGYRMVRISSDPVTWKLYHECDWEGAVFLTSADVCNGARVRCAILEQVGVLRDMKFCSGWVGSGKRASSQADAKPLSEVLVLLAEKEEAAPESRRLNVAAEYLWEILAKSKNAEEGDQPRKDGTPVKIGDDCWFGYRRVKGLIDARTDVVSERDLMDLLNKLSANTLRRTVSGSKSRFRVLDHEGLILLENMAVSDGTEKYEERTLAGGEE